MYTTKKKKVVEYWKVDGQGQYIYIIYNGVGPRLYSLPQHFLCIYIVGV